MSYTPIDNILGQPLPDYVINQLRIRSDKTLDKRDNQALVYTANKSGWVRVVSSVDVSGSLAGISTYSGPELAKNNVLFGGMSAYKSTEDKGFTYEIKPYYSKEAFDPTYGFRPMSGITSAKIITQGKLGSILIAEIDFKANTKAQLDLIDILYFKIGYSMLVEWGNTFFYRHKKNPNNELIAEPQLYKSEDYAIDPFAGNPDKETVRIKIAKAVRETEGNYGGMLGVITNYSFSINSEGGYDCKIKIMAPGMLAESMRVNSINSLPKVYIEAIELLASKLTTINQKNAEIERQQRRQVEAQQFSKDANAYPPCVRNLIDSRELEFKTVNDVTGVGAKNDTGVFKPYVFYYDTNNPTSPTSGRYSGPEGTRNYTCDKYGNILDKDRGTIIGRTISEKPLTVQEEYELVKKDSDNFKDIQSARYSSIPLRNYPSDPNLVDYLTRDNKVDGNKKHFWISKKFNKKIYVREPQRALPISSTTATINLDPKLFGIDKINTSNVSDWIGVLQWHSTKDFPIPNTNKTFKLTYDDFDTIGTAADPDDLFGKFEGESTEFIIDYNRGNGNKRLVIRYLHQFNRLDGEMYVDEDEYTVTFGKLREEDRLKIEAVIGRKLLENVNWDVEAINEERYGIVLSTYIAVDNLPYTYSTRSDKRSGRALSSIIENKSGEGKLAVKVGVSIKEDFELIKQINSADSPDEPQLQTQPNATSQAPDSQQDYVTINAKRLADSEQAMYTSQLETMLRVVQITTISETISDNGSLDQVKSIKWTDDKHRDRLYNGLFIDGAMRSAAGSILRDVVNATGDPFSGGRVSDNNRIAYLNGNMNRLLRYKTNLYYGFHRSLMKMDDKTMTIFEKLDRPEYKVDFKELLTSYVIPYYQSKNLVDGGDIHYPTYIPLGFFFMMLNHCCFLYDTSDSSVNVPLFYLDFNPGSNVMLSSDFMLTANPYKFVVPFTGDSKSYKKLFDNDLISRDGLTVGSGSDSSEIWKYDAVSDYVPKFKSVVQSGDSLNVYRGKTMNVLASIDYLLDIIKRHSQRDETNSVYFRPLIEEILSDLGKCLGSFNIFRLAYDDHSNCFYVTDDQTVPGDDVFYENDNKDIELPLFGKKSVARSLSIVTENSSKLGNVAAVGANADVRNQSTLGIDGTSIGGLNLFAIDRYKRVTTGANDNAQITGSNSGSDRQQRAVAASRFNEAVNSFYYGGLRSEGMVDQAVNYYIERVAKARNSDADPNLRAAMLLPISVNFSTDGISSMAIYQAFTINDQLLPYSYKYGMGQTNTRKMGFIITGLEHTIQNNAWTTDVKANMYYVKRKGDYKQRVGRQEKALKWKDIPSALVTNSSNVSSNGVINYRTNFVSSKEQKAIDARKITEQYLGRTLIDNDWNCLIAAAYAESNYKDRSRQATWCAAVIINRARKSGRTIYEELTLPRQFQAVTGTSKNGNAPSNNYVKGPSSSIEFIIYDGIIAELSKIDHRYLNFTSNLNAAYEEGTDISYKRKLENSPGKNIVGDTIFAFG